MESKLPPPLPVLPMVLCPLHRYLRYIAFIDYNTPMSKFVHLHTHSHYSLLEALPKIPDLVKKARLSGMDALALTDSGNLYGAIEFYKECRVQKIKPIFGVDFYVALRTRNDKEARIDNERSRLVLLAENNLGYKNLLKLVTDSNLEGFYYKPRIDKELIEKYRDGLIAILPASTSTGIEEKIEYYKKVFGADHFFLEITHHPEIRGHEEQMEKRTAFAKQKNVPIVAAHDIYYLEPEDKPARNTLLSIQNNLPSSVDGGVFGENNEDLSFISTKDVKKYFKETPEAIENTERISNRCNVELELGKWVFPNIEMLRNIDPDKALTEIVYEGFKSRNLKETEIAIKRVEYELNVIKDKGCAK